MITIKTAKQIAEKHYKSEKVWNCVDHGNYFIFQLVPKEYDGREELCGTLWYAVNKFDGTGVLYPFPYVKDSKSFLKDSEKIIYFDL